MTILFIFTIPIKHPELGLGPFGSILLISFCLLMAAVGDIVSLGYISRIFKYDNWFSKVGAGSPTFELIGYTALGHMFPYISIDLTITNNFELPNNWNGDNKLLFMLLIFVIWELLLFTVPLLIYHIISRAKQQRAKHLSTEIELLDKNLSDCEIRLENRKNILHLLPLLASCGGAVEPIYADSRISSDRALAQQITALKQKIAQLSAKM